MDEELIENEEDLKVVYVVRVGVDYEGDTIYQMMVGYDSDKVWAENWEQVPASNNGDITPQNDMYDYVKQFKAKIKLGTAQENNQFSMQDCRDGIVALAWEDLSEAEEYPDDGRIVIHFGDSLSDVEGTLKRRNIFTKFI